MSFSEYLGSYIKENEVSLPKLAKQVGIDRVTLFRYTTGDRKPANDKIVKNIANALCMSAAEKEHLLDEYDKSVMGEDIVNSYKYMCKMMNSLADVNDLLDPKYNFQKESDTADFTQEDESTIIKSQQALLSYIVRMLYNAAKSDSSSDRIMILMQPTNTKVQEMLIPLLSGADVTVDQIICFEKNIEKSYLNLEALENIITQSFALKNYNVYYHYEILSSFLSSSALLPNVIIACGCMVTFNSDMTRGFFSRYPKLVDFISEEFDSIKKNCSRLIEESNYALDIGSMQLIVQGTKIGSIFEQPCIAPCCDRKNLNETLCDFPAKQYIIDTLIRQNGDWNGLERTESGLYVEKIISCCTKEGIELFLKTGRVGEFPEMYYNALSYEFRLEILKRMVILQKQGMISYYIIKEPLNLLNNMQCYWSVDDIAVSFRQIKKDSMLQISMKEASIFNTVLNFIEYLKIKNMLIKDDDVIEYLEDLIKKAENHYFRG